MSSRTPTTGYLSLKSSLFLAPFIPNDIPLSVKSLNAIQIQLMYTTGGTVLPQRQGLPTEAHSRYPRACPNHTMLSHNDRIHSQRRVEVQPCALNHFSSCHVAPPSCQPTQPHCEQRTEADERPAQDGRHRFQHVETTIHPSPGVMLTSCLVLGCSISSFLYRHQHSDAYQPVVFFVIIVWAIVLGYGVGASANMVMLGFVPWATCAAMLLSGCGHAMLRKMQSRRSSSGTGSFDEKAGLVT